MTGAGLHIFSGPRAFRRENEPSILSSTKVSLCFLTHPRTMFTTRTTRRRGGGRRIAVAAHHAAYNAAHYALAVD